MNVGILIDHRAKDLERRFELASEAGFAHFQLTSWEPERWTSDEAERLRALCAKYRMTMTAFWCGWSGPKRWNFTDGPQTLGLVPVAYRAQRLRELMDGAAFARGLGVTDVVTHMGFVPEDPGDPAYPGFRAAVRALAEALGAQGQALLFETGQETPVALLRLFEDVGLDNLYVNLDPANLVMYGKGNPVDALDVLGGRVRGVHAKDGLYPTSGRELGAEVRIGAGKVDFPALLRGLCAHGYDGSLTIEREIDGDEQLRDILASRDYLTGLLQAL